MKLLITESLMPGYDFIVGCDIIQKAGLKMRVESGDWRFWMGKRRYRVATSTGDGSIEIGAVEFDKPAIQNNVNIDRDLFYQENETLPTTGKTVHQIILKSDNPVYVKDRRYPQAMRDIIRGQLGILLRKGIIRHSNSPFNSSLWMVEKKHGEAGETEKQYHVVVDYRKLNEATVDERYPLPRVEDILDRLSDATIFSTLELKSGYHQVIMAEEDIGKTAFS